MKDNKKINLGGVELQKVCDIEPEKDGNDNIIEYRPQPAYKNLSNLPLHKYGGGSFCRFKIPSEWSGKAGMYVITVNGIPRYVGECDDLTRRYNMGYGNISPRNCYKGGQQTNCRINKNVLEEKKKGFKIALYFTGSDNRFELEHYLIMKIKPDWNRSIGKPSLRQGYSAIQKKKILYESRVPRTRKTVLSGYSGKYQPLELYLSNLRINRIRLSYAELESILGFSLPPSAYKHRAWWANGGHRQANAWLEVGWKVMDINLGANIVFIRS